MVRVMAVAVLIGAIGVVGWFLLAPEFIATDALIPPIPNVTSDGPVVRNGGAVVVACEKKRGFLAVDIAPEGRTGTWGVEKRGECNVYYHHQPGTDQRYQRHESAHQQDGS